MKNDESYKSSARFFFFAVVGAIIVMIFIVLANDANAAGKKHREFSDGYLVCVTTKEVPHQPTKPHKLTSTEAVENIINNYFPGIGYDLETHFSTNNLLVIQKDRVVVYAEKKKVFRSKTGKLKFKKYSPR